MLGLLMPCVLPGSKLSYMVIPDPEKTTLLVNKLHQLYDKHITSRCMEGTR